jgi:Rieske Fe-S protein
MMNRRAILKWLSAALGVTTSAIVLIPGAGYVAQWIRRRPARDALVQRLIRLGDLPVGRPKIVPVIGNKQDAWTLYPAEPVGRVWLVRESDDTVAGENAKVSAFTAICPHLGCQIQLDSRGEAFVCPCHQAAFHADGSPVADRKLGHRNHAPRGMDPLDCRLVQDDDSGEWWVEVKYEKFEPGLTKRVVKA